MTENIDIYAIALTEETKEAVEEWLHSDEEIDMDQEMRSLGMVKTIDSHGEQWVKKRVPPRRRIQPPRKMASA
jgi:metal-sulfur cluster biosynthetic enzyme